MINLKQFTKDAIRTESVVDVVAVDIDELKVAMKEFIRAGNKLDQLKKNVFYGKPCTDMFLEWDKIQAPHINTRAFHALIGAATESTELMEALYKHVFDGKDLDAVNIMEEFSDIAWYEAIAADELGFDMEEGREKVISKLKKRYPEKFTSYDAINRDLDAEREILEGNL